MMELPPTPIVPLTIGNHDTESPKPLGAFPSKNLRRPSISHLRTNSSIISESQTFSSPTESSPTQLKRKRPWGGLKTVFVSGIGFLADAYDLFVIDFVVAILSVTSFEEPTVADKGLIASSTLAGAVVGQLAFGIGADFIGRRIMFISTAALIIVGAVVSASVGQGYTTSALSFSIFHQLAVTRFVEGLGIGGEYPLSATVTSEANEVDNNNDGGTSRTGCWYFSTKPNSIAAVFSMQGVGMLLSPLLVMLLIKSGVPLDIIWRICLGMSAVPSAIAFYFRWQMHESPSFKKSQRKMTEAEQLGIPRRQSCSTGAPPTTRPRASTNFPSERRDSDGIPPRSMSHHAGDPGPIRKVSDWISGGLNTYRVPYTPLEPVEDQSTKNGSSSGSDEATPPPAVLESPSISPSKERCLPSFGRHLKHTWHTLKLFRYTLLGTAMCWFLIDVTLYGTGSFKTAVIGSLVGDTTTTKAPNEVRALDHSSLQSTPLSDSLYYRPVEFIPTRQKLQRDSIRRLMSSIATETDNGSQWFLKNSQPSSSSRIVRRRLEDASPRDKIFQEAEMSAVVALLAIPGYFLSVFFIHKTGLKRLQLWGFIAVALVFFVLGGEQLLRLEIVALELILFGASFLCSNFGPNTTTFILPTTLYPTAVRATCHGFSAAMGKLGGVVGTSLFGPLQNQLGLGGLLMVCGAVGLVGAVFTYYFIPTEEQGIQNLLKADGVALEGNSNNNTEIELIATTPVITSATVHAK